MTATDRLAGLVGSAPMKLACRVATTANITLEGLQTIDSVVLVADDRVLVKNQTSAINNGIYIADSGEWVRAPDFNGTRDIVKGTLVRVNEGTIAAGKLYAVSTTDYEPVIGTDTIAFVTSGIGIASSITVTPVGSVAATDVQAAIQELDSEKLAASSVGAFALTYLDDANAAAFRVTTGTAAPVGVNCEIFTSTDTFEKAALPAHVTHVTVHVWGAGGGGGGGDTDGFRGVGGGGGGYSRERIAVASLATSETVTIGAGGAGGTGAASPSAGANGGTSSFGAFLSATGGTGGTAGVTGAQAGVAGGAGSGGDLNLTGGDSALKVADTTGVSIGGDGAMSGGTGGALNIATAGRLPGGGGSAGNHSSGNGGAGAAGLVIVEWQ